MILEARDSTHDQGIRARSKLRHDDGQDISKSCARRR